MAVNKEVSEMTPKQNDDPKLEKEVAALKEDMARLREDIADLTRALGENVSGYKDSAQEELLRRARQAQAQATEQLEKAQAVGQKVVEDMETKIVEKPLMSLRTAASVGFILAKLLDVRGRH